jgi:hypothetical protein
MRTCVSTFIGPLAIAVAVSWLVSVSLGAQARRPAGPTAAATNARTADGHPDLQGVYEIATITPLERPTQFGNRANLTREEAAAMETYEQQRQVKNDAPLAADRGAPPVGGDTSQPKSYLEFLERAGGVVGGYNNFWLAGGTQIITVNGEKRSSIIVDPPDGRIPQMTPDARRRRQALLASAVDPSASEASAAAGPPGAFDGPELRPLAERCLLGFGSTAGPPTLPNYFYNNPKQIVQTPTTIMILVEMVHDVRIIRMNAEHLPPTVRKWLGDSVATGKATRSSSTRRTTNKTQFRVRAKLHVVELLA